MVDARRVPCICDFGISQILDQAGFVRYNTSLTRYLAPERFTSLEGEGESAKITPASPPTASSDVYAFACLVLLVCTYPTSKTWLRHLALTLVLIKDSGWRESK
jgi:serine/threonine protein kinase